MIRTIRGTAYQPTTARSGSEGNGVFRMSNLIKNSGNNAESYWVSTIGPQDLGETIATSALTGTATLTSGSKIVTGTTTVFKTELHLGQLFLVIDAVGHRSFPCVVERIVSDTSVVIARAPTFTGTVAGKTGYRMPVIFPVDNQRGTQIRGNAIRYDKGTIFSVGDGTFRLDGATLGGSSLTPTRKPQVSTLNPATGNYTNAPLGLPDAAKPTLTNVAGGVKGMQPAIYGIVVTAERIETVGYGNPSLVATVTIAAGERIQIDFGAMDGPSLQNAWGVWGTRYVDAQDTTGKNYLNGPWFRVMAGSGDNGQVIAADLTGTTMKTEWLDGEIEVNDKVSFDNDPPPDAEFVDGFNNVPVWISCTGPGNTSPGVRVFPAKPSNVEAAPSGLAYPTSHGEVIIGVVAAQGRLYLLTPNHLQVTIGTGNDNLPIIIQPYWKAGFKNPYQLDFVNGVLYGCTTSGPSRSASAGDEQEAEKVWASDLDEFSGNWTIGHVYVRHDPMWDAMCYLETAHSLNASGFWTTRVWGWSLGQQEWIFDMLFTSTTHDSIVSGVATVGDHLEFLMGGRKSDDTMEVKTYRFDTGSGSAVPWYVAPQYSDFGMENHSHVIKSVRVNGQMTSPALKVYGSKPTATVDVAALESGNGALATIAPSTTTTVTQGKRYQLNVKNLMLSTLRIEGAYSGSGERDRLDEIVIEAEPQGGRR